MSDELVILELIHQAEYLFGLASLVILMLTQKRKSQIQLFSFS